MTVRARLSLAVLSTGALAILLWAPGGGTWPKHTSNQTTIGSGDRSAGLDERLAGGTLGGDRRDHGVAVGDAVDSSNTGVGLLITGSPLS